MESKEKEKNLAYAHMLSHEEINAMPGREMKEKRTRNGKLYDLGDGHYQAVLCPQPVHAKNDQGEWEEIDHTLVQKGNEYENTSPDLSVRFSPGGVVTLNQGKYTLSWSLPGAVPAVPKEIKPEKKSVIPRQDEKINLESAVEYHELLPGVDMIARIQPNRFKDVLVFKNQQSLRPVEFHLHAPGMQLVQKEDGDVLALDGDDMIFRLPAPFAVDEQDNPVSGSAHAALKELDREYWAWIVEVDKEFAAGVALPIRLDPVVETGQASDNASMAYVTSEEESISHPVNTQEITKIAHNYPGEGECFTFLRYDTLPEIDSSYYVTAATLTMRSRSNNGGKNVYLREVRDDWDPTTITYIMATNGTVTVGDKYLEYANVGGTGTVVNFNIANQVRQWYTGTNHGLRLK